MYRPVLVEAPTTLPITVEEVKRALRIETADDDALLEHEIRAAVAHYEGWTGILGICLAEQTWRQEFDGYGCLQLPLGPVLSITSVKYCNRQGLIATVGSDEYTLRTDAAGCSFVCFRSTYRLPSDLYETAGVQVEYTAGWPNTDDSPPRSTVPHDIRTAIILRVQLAYDEAAKNGSDHLNRAEHALISKYRRFRI